MHTHSRHTSSVVHRRMDRTTNKKMKKSINENYKVKFETKKTATTTSSAIQSNEPKNSVSISLELLELYQRAATKVLLFYLNLFFILSVYIYILYHSFASSLKWSLKGIEIPYVKIDNSNANHDAEFVANAHERNEMKNSNWFSFWSDVGFIRGKNKLIINIWTRKLALPFIHKKKHTHASWKSSVFFSSLILRFFIYLYIFFSLWSKNVHTFHTPVETRLTQESFDTFAKMADRSFCCTHKHTHNYRRRRHTNTPAHHRWNQCLLNAYLNTCAWFFEWIACLCQCGGLRSVYVLEKRRTFHQNWCFVVFGSIISLSLIRHAFLSRLRFDSILPLYSKLNSLLCSDWW